MTRKTPEQRFKVVAASRANRAIKALQLLSKCSNTRYYSYQRSEIDTMFSKIERALQNAKGKFSESNFDQVTF